MVGTHTYLAQRLWAMTRNTDVSDKRSLTNAYMGLWRYFYIEYLCIPFWGR